MFFCISPDQQKKEVEFIIIERCKSLLSCDHHVEKLKQLRNTVKRDCSTSEKLHDFKIQEEEGVKGKEGGGGTSHMAQYVALFSKLGWKIISGNVLGTMLQLCLHLI